MLDPSLAEAREVLGIADAYQGRWVDAEGEFQQALALDRNDSEIRSAYGGLVLTALGHLRRGLQETTEAYRGAPANPFVVLRLAWCTNALGLSAETARYTELAGELGYDPGTAPIPSLRQAVAARAQKYAEAAEYAAGAQDRESNDVREVASQVYLALDDSQKKRAIAALDKLLTPPSGAGAIDDIEWYVRLGALDRAYERAETEVDAAQRSGLVSLNGWTQFWWPEMRAFRQDPRFSAFISRGRFMNYWKRYGPPDECDLKDGKLTCH